MKKRDVHKMWPCKIKNNEHHEHHENSVAKKTQEIEAFFFLFGEAVTWRVVSRLIVDHQNPLSQ